MSLIKHYGRRAAAVGIGVGLLVLGLEAPAWAAPAVAGFTPTSGKAGCVVDVTGTGFTEFPEAQTDVDFVDLSTTPETVLSATFTTISDTEIWAAVPTVVAGTEYNIRVSNPGTPGGATSTATFLATVGNGTCAPTVTTFLPACGSAGTTVAITGTNLLNADFTGGHVWFSPYDTGSPAGTEAVHTVPDSSSPTSLSVIVPSDAKDGPIKVITDVASAFSTTSFLVPPPDCAAAVPFARGVTLRLRDALVARGKVSASSATAPAGCTAAVPVKIQRRASGHWKTVGKTTTTDTGAYRKKIRNRHGKYRSLAPKLTLASGDVCSRAVSKAVKH
jgi:hypothetical protein